MAYKLYGLRFRIKKLEELIFLKGFKQTISVIPCIARTRSHHSLCKNHHVVTVPSSRFIHIQTHLNAAKVVPFILSDIGEGIVEVGVKEWFVKPGDKVSQFDPVCDVQSDKASVTISSRYDGVIKKLHYEVDDVAKVGQPLLDILIEEEGSEDIVEEVEVESKKPELKDLETSRSEGEYHLNKALATPAVRRIAKENNVNLKLVPPTGKGGRILKEDVLAFLEKEKLSPAAVPLREVESDKVTNISGFKKAMVKTMTAAWAVPHFSYSDEVNANELIHLKPELQRLSKSKDVKITFMPFFIKAASLSLQKYPILNSLVDDSCENITLKLSHNIGVAIDTPNGLIVPNIKNVQSLSIIQIAKELNRLQDLGAKGQIGINDLKDGTFTLSNIGAIGGTYTKPIIFTPQVAIGALGKVQTLPRFDSHKNVVEANIFNISWSADHRVIDGATIARFSNLWKAYVESPKLLLQL